MSITLTRESIKRYELELEERYRRAKDAIQLMRQMLNQGESGFPTIDPGLAGVSAAGAQHASLPPLEATTEAQSLAGKIEQVCEEFHDDRWTMRRMLKYLQQIGFDLRDKPEGSISAALGKLAQGGKLKVVRRGAGSMASIYQWRSPDEPVTDTQAHDGEAPDEEPDISDGESTSEQSRPELVKKEALG